MTKICISSESVEKRDAAIASFRKALEQIAMMIPGDKVPASSLSESQWLRKHIVEMRIVAQDALTAN